MDVVQTLPPAVRVFDVGRTREMRWRARRFARPPSCLWMCGCVDVDAMSDMRLPHSGTLDPSIASPVSPFEAFFRCSPAVFCRFCTAL
jgi:hypothetical protein